MGVSKRVATFQKGWCCGISSLNGVSSTLRNQGIPEGLVGESQEGEEESAMQREKVVPSPGIWREHIREAGLLWLFRVVGEAWMHAQLCPAGIWSI